MGFNNNLFKFRARLQPVTSLHKKCDHPGRVSTSELDNQFGVRHFRTIIFFVAFLVLSSLAAWAQTPTYLYDGGTSSNSFPLNTTSSPHVQWLYYASDFSSAPTGNINTIYLRTNTTGSKSVTGLRVRMGYSTLTAFSSGPFETGLTTVYNNTGTSSFTIPTNGWMAITLTTPFYFDGSQSFIVEVSHTGTTAPGISVWQKSNTTNGRKWGALNATGTVSNGSGLADFGFDLIPDCNAPSGPSASNVTSTAATLSWLPATGVSGYEYHVTTSATVPATPFTSTTGTSISLAGLDADKEYFLYVRSRCSARSFSLWVKYPFRTNPPCTKRTFRIHDITTAGATVTWNGAAHADDYDFALSRSADIPTSSTTLTDTFFKATMLSEGTKYYVHVRKNCAGNEVSDWALDSFTTRIICRPPSLQVNDVSTNRAIVFWDEMPSAKYYEYEISQSAMPLGDGTKIERRSFLAFPLRDGEVYYFHVRSNCEDQGFVSQSDWATLAFRTFPLSLPDARRELLVVEAYPNPATNKITIDIHEAGSGSGTLTITDISGRCMQKSAITANKTDVDISNYAKGIYLIQYSSATGSRIIKIIKE